jgi:hypothetical protein
VATLLDEFARLTAEFDRRQVPYAVCGGWAMTIHGAPRATIDIDVMVSPDNLDEAWRVATELGYNIEGRPLEFRDGGIQIRRISKVDAETEALITIDFLLVTEATQQIWQTRHPVEWERGKISIVSREGLIQLKRLGGRSQDLADIERLENEC